MNALISDVINTPVCMVIRPFCPIYLTWRVVQRPSSAHEERIHLDRRMAGVGCLCPEYAIHAV